jgi:hypothetical protein
MLLGKERPEAIHPTTLTELLTQGDHERNVPSFVRLHPDQRYELVSPLKLNRHLLYQITRLCGPVAFRPAAGCLDNHAILDR